MSLRKLHRFILFIGLSFCYAHGLTQLTFGDQQIIIGQTDGNDVTTADLNNDGLPDLISCNADDDVIIWYENLGNGIFSSEIIISTNANQAVSVFAEDIDGDGDIDVLSASREDDKIAWYENLGEGVFSSEIIISTSADGASSVYAADIDGDGDMDVLSTSYNDDKIAWYENLGDGIFSSEIIISTNADGAEFVYADDIDGDGDIDVISASRFDDKIAWYENLGDGVFSSEIIISNNADGASSVYATDIDGDGDMDVLAASREDDKIAWYENLGDGIFSSEIIISTSADRALDVYAADIDGDGDIDVLSASIYDDKIAWYENLGDGNFSSEIIISTNADGARSVYAADIDGDGDIDVLSASLTDGKLAWYENLGNGVFSSEIVISTIAEGARSVYAADLDGDDDMDVLSASSQDDKIAWYENLGDGVFSSQIIISTDADGAVSVYPTDIDGDGDMDVLSASYNDNKIAWYENLGEGVFSSEIIISTSADEALDVYAEDIDGDGDSDVLAASREDDKIAWYENLGEGVFSSEIIISTSADEAFDVYAEDIDGDGDIDVLSASSYPYSKIALYENIGGGAFASEIIISTDVSGAVSVYAEDIDGDGDTDVLSASNLDDKIAWYENLGDGIFSSQIIISTNADGASSVFANDIDGDGDTDVLSASEFDDKIAWYENLGNGVFVSESIISTDADVARSVYTADLDGDGDIDVISASLTDDKIAWYENLGILGCTNATACNYNENATDDDGSCCFENCGCTNVAANNYNPDVTCDDGSCTFTFSGFVYNDEDENGSFDNDDFVLAFQEIYIEPLGVTIITNDEGEFYYEHNGVSALNFTVGFNPQFPFNITPGSITLNTSSDPDLSMEFGLAKEQVDFGICIDLYPSGNGFLCNDWSNHNICYRNMGNVAIDGIVELEYDPLFQGHAEVTPIDSVNGNSVYMSFENLQPGQMFFYDVDLLTPTVDHIGEYVTSIARVTGYFQGGQVAYGEKTLEMEIACAYDPNDKQAFPIGYTEDHLLLQETEQEFLIRFQNTGNAPAQDIRIQDTLDVNFDLESFKLMANSHSVMTTIDPETRLIDFYFEDIQLPDSVNDEPNSHGLISYKITPLPNLPVGTVLENTAYIYFDNNEPIITNTTWTTIHECGGEAAVTSSASLVCEETLVNFEGAYPLVEEYAWELEGEDAGNEEDFQILPASASYEVTLVASNPLCTEINSFVYEVPEFELLDPCLADFTCDGQRNTDDLIAFLAAFGCTEACAEDLDGNDTVDTVDLIVFLGLYSRACWE